MTPGDARSERVYRSLLRAYPDAFRARFTDEMVQLFSDQLREARSGGATGGRARVWLKSVGDLVVTSTSEHMRRDRTMAHSLSASPSPLNRVLGLAGVLGGAVLLAAFLVDIAPGLVPLRLAVVNLGAIGIVVAVHSRQVRVAPALALVGAVPALVANALFLATVVIGDIGLLSFYAAVAMWLADAAFGVVTFRIGAVARWGALALAIGSPLAVAGIDRIGLVSAEDPTLWGPLALAGVALNGLGWILLGIDVATRRSASEVGPPKERLGD